MGLGLVGAGFAAGRLASGAGARRLWRGGGRARRAGAADRVALWAADRAGHAVYGLASDGAVLQRFEVRAPMEVRSAPGSGCRVHSALEGRLDGPSGWFEWTGSRLRGSSVPPAEATTDGIVRVKPDGSGEGAWVLRGPGASSRIERWVGPEAERGPWSRRMIWPLPFEARAVAPSGAAAWVAGFRTPVALLIHREGGVLREVELSGADGVEDALAIPSALGGGVWLAACGALVRLDPRGRRLPGQGGFAHLVSLAAGNAALAVSRPRAAVPPRRAFR